MAHLKAVERAGDNEKRYQWKVSLIKRLYRSGYKKQDVIRLFDCIDWVMALPEELEEQLWTKIQISPNSVHPMFAGLTSEQLEELGERFVDAESLDEI